MTPTTPWSKFRTFPLIAQVLIWLFAYPVPLGLVVHHSIRLRRAGQVAFGAIEFGELAYEEARRIMDGYRHRRSQVSRGPHVLPPTTPSPSPGDPLQEYLDVLGIDRSAGQAEVRAAWVELNVQLHPDRHMNEPFAQRQRLEDRLKRVNAAYGILKQHGIAA